jgi:hypothetical protein
MLVGVLLSLSEGERWADIGARHAKIRDQHLYLSVLQSLPESQAHLDDTPVFYPSMGASLSFCEKVIAFMRFG